MILEESSKDFKVGDLVEIKDFMVWAKFRIKIQKQFGIILNKEDWTDVWNLYLINDRRTIRLGTNGFSKINK